MLPELFTTYQVELVKKLHLLGGMSVKRVTPQLSNPRAVLKTTFSDRSSCSVGGGGLHSAWRARCSSIVSRLFWSAKEGTT